MFPSSKVCLHFLNKFVVAWNAAWSKYVEHRALGKPCVDITFAGGKSENGKPTAAGESGAGKKRGGSKEERAPAPKKAKKEDVDGGGGIGTKGAGVDGDGDIVMEEGPGPKDGANGDDAKAGSPPPPLVVGTFNNKQVTLTARRGIQHEAGGAEPRFWLAFLVVPLPGAAPSSAAAPGGASSAAAPAGALDPTAGAAAGSSSAPATGSAPAGSSSSPLGTPDVSGQGNKIITKTFMTTSAVHGCSAITPPTADWTTKKYANLLLLTSHDCETLTPHDFETQTLTPHDSTTAGVSDGLSWTELMALGLSYAEEHDLGGAVRSGPGGTRRLVEQEAFQKILGEELEKIQKKAPGGKKKK